MRYANPVSYPSDVYKKCSAVVCAYVCVWVWCDVGHPSSRCAVFQCEGGGYDESGTVLFVQCRKHDRDAVGRVLGYRVCFCFPLNLTPCRRCSISVPNACVKKTTVKKGRKINQMQARCQLLSFQSVTMTHNASCRRSPRICRLLSIQCSQDTPALRADVPTDAAAAGAAVPSPASPPAVQQSSVDACTAADSDWHSGAGTLVWLLALLLFASKLLVPPVRRAWCGN